MENNEEEYDEAFWKAMDEVDRRLASRKKKTVEYKGANHNEN